MAAAKDYVVHEVPLACPPAEPLLIPLSDCDLFGPRMHMKIDLFFPLAAHVDTAALFASLRAGLAAALSQMLPLASRVTDDEPPSRTHLRINPDSTIQLGERHLSRPTFADLAADWFDLAALDHTTLLPADLQKYVFTLGAPPTPANHVPAMFAQANFVPGGLILAAAFHHTVADAWSMHRFTALWALHTKRAATGAAYAPLDYAVDWDRTPYKAPRELDANDPNLERKWIEWGMPTLADKSQAELVAETQRAVNPKDVVGMLMHMSAARLAELKAKASPAPPAFVSSYDALVALIWRTVLRARIATGRFTAAESAMLRQPANARGRSPEAKLAYIGNAAAPGVSDAIPTADIIGEDGLRVAAQASRAGITRSSIERLRKFIDFATVVPADKMRTLRLALTVSTLTVTSWQQMNAFQEYDFGFGFPAAFRSPGTPFDGGAIVFPTPPGEGVTFWLGLHPENAEVLKKDDEFNAYVEIKSVAPAGSF